MEYEIELIMNLMGFKMLIFIVYISAVYNIEMCVMWLILRRVAQYYAAIIRMRLPLISMYYSVNIGNT